MGELFVGEGGFRHGPLTPLDRIRVSQGVTQVSLWLKDKKTQRPLCLASTKSVETAFLCVCVSPLLQLKATSIETTSVLFLYKIITKQHTLNLALCLFNFIKL